MSDQASDEGRTFDRIEILEVTVLALVAIAIAWSGYQATRWGGRQALLRIRVGANALALGMLAYSLIRSSSSRAHSPVRRRPRADQTSIVALILFAFTADWSAA